MPKKNTTLYVLKVGSGEYDNYVETIVGIVTDKEFAETFAKTDDFSSFEAVKFNVVDENIRKQVADFLDPTINPMCVCGHPLLHHTGKRKGCKFHKCFDNTAVGKKHDCKKFTLARKRSKKS